jgi:chaperonin GroES
MLKSLAELFPTSDYSVQNAVDLFTKSELDDIAQKIQFDYDQDLTTCSRKFEELKKIMALAMIVTETKSYPWNGASNVIFPLIANAAINYGSLFYPGVIQDDAVVKAKIIGKDNGKIVTFNGEKQADPENPKEYLREGAGDKLKRGNRVATMMNWQLLEQMPWWELDIDKEGHSLPILGTLYKKVYYDSLRKMPVSELIYPDKIVINNGARDIDSAVVTQIIELYPQEIMERIRSGYYKEFDFDLKELESQSPQADASTTTTTPNIKPNKDVQFNNNLHKFLEQHTWLDLDEDGFLEPYIATIHYDTCQTVRIIPRFEESDIIKNKETGKIQEIKACKYFEVRRFLPSLDGGFLGTGLGHLLFNMNNTINTALNQMIDAGHLSVTGGGLIDNRVKIRGGKLTISQNEYKLVNVTGGDLANAIYPFPKTEPSAVLFNLLGALIEAGKELGSMRDVLNGEGAMNTPATVYMGMVDQGHKTLKSVFKRHCKSLKTEFKMIYDLNRKYLTNEEYANILDEDEEDVSVKDDFDDRSYNIVPVADVNSIISAQKYAQANFLSGFIGSRNVDQYKLIKQIFTTARIDDVDKLVVQAPPAVDPAIQIAQMDMQVKMASQQVATQKIALEMDKLKLEVPKMAAEVEKIRSSIMLDFANVGKIGQEADLSKQEQQIKIASHLVDAEISQIETAAHLHEAELRHKNELLKLAHEHAQNSMDREHEKEMAKANIKSETNAN